MGKLFLQAIVLLFILVLTGYSHAENSVVLSLKPLRHGIKQAKVKINGISAWMIVDTGGGWTIVGNELADKIGCKPFGQITGFRQTGQKLSSPKCGTFPFEVEGIAARGFVSLYEVASVLPKSWPKVDGVVAFPSLGIERFTLDWSGNQIILESSQSLIKRTKGLPAGRIKIQSESAGTGKSVFIEISGKPEPLWFLLDSGNVAATVISPSSFEQLGRKRIESKKRDGHQATTILNLNIAGQAVENLHSNVLDIIYDGNLGTDFLNRFVVSIDMVERHFWLMPK